MTVLVHHPVTHSVCPTTGSSGTVAEPRNPLRHRKNPRTEVGSPSKIRAAPKPTVGRGQSGGLTSDLGLTEGRLSRIMVAQPTDIAPAPRRAGASWNYYPEQLRSIAAMCETLDSYDKLPEAAGELAFRFRTCVPIEDNDGTLIGALVDEVGGVWSFRPVDGAQS